MQKREVPIFTKIKICTVGDRTKKLSVNLFQKILIFHIYMIFFRKCSIFAKAFL